MNQDTLSMIAIAISLIALATSIFSARTSARSLKQSGAIASLTGEWLRNHSTGTLTLKVKVFNRGRAEVDLQHMTFVLVNRDGPPQGQLFQPVEEERRIKGYSHREYLIPITIPRASERFKGDNIITYAEFGDGTAEPMFKFKLKEISKVIEDEVSNGDSSSEIKI